MPPRGARGQHLKKVSSAWSARPWGAERRGDDWWGTRGGQQALTLAPGLTQSAHANFVIPDVPSVQRVGSQLLFVDMNVSGSHLSVS